MRCRSKSSSGGDRQSSRSSSADVDPLIITRIGSRIVMCRNIRTLHNFEPPATDEEIRASSLQFVRKLSGFTRPSKANQAAFNRAVEQVTGAAHELRDALVTTAAPRDREVEAAKARGRAAHRFRSCEARRSV